MELSTWLLSQGHFTAEQSATLLRHLLLPGALANLATELRGGQGGGAGGAANAHDGSGPMRHRCAGRGRL